MRATCEEPSQASRLDGARKPPKRSSDEHASSWFNAAVETYPKAEALASDLEVSSGVLSELRSGKRSVALRRLLPLLEYPPSALAFCEAFLTEVAVAEHPDAVLALVAPLLEEIGYVARPIKRMSRAEIAEALLADLEGEPMGRKLIDLAGEKRGASPEHVAVALRGEGEGTK